MTDPWAPPDAVPSRAGGWSVPPAVRTPRGDGPSPRSLAATAVVVASAVVLLGAPVGLLWASIAPQEALTVQGPAVVTYAAVEREASVGADASFVGLTLLVGLACGLLAWRFARRFGPAVVVALTVGGLGAAAVAAEVGERVGFPQLAMEVRRGVPGPVQSTVELRSPQAVAIWPIGALAGFCVPLLRRREDPPVSWG